MRRLLIGLSAFALGGTAAAALSIAARPQARASTAEPTAHATVLPARTPVTATSLRQAYAAGLVDRPVKSVLNVRTRMNYGEYRWNEAGVPAGPIWVRVDLRSQLVSVFRGGDEIGTAVILYGADGVPTPTGKFAILAKLKDHRSATYDAAMPYTLRLTTDGVSIHASNVRWGYATHGCIGVPEGFAARLFDSARLGDEVLIVDASTPTRSANF